jgi:hypothetical protein
MGKGGKNGKAYTKASRKAAALLVKGTNSTYMTKGKLASYRVPRAQSSASTGDGSYHTHETTAASKGKYF